MDCWPAWASNPSEAQVVRLFGEMLAGGGRQICQPIT